MIIDLFDKLVSRIIDLLKEEQRQKRSLHDNFIIPMMTLFEEIHNNYIQTFVGYREAINQAIFPLSERHPLIEEIKKDSLLSDAIRIKHDAMWQAIDESKDDSLELMILLSEIASYFSATTEEGLTRNLTRERLLVFIPNANKETAIYVVEENIKHLQDMYSRIQRSYQGLKMKLIK